jgi:subtilisin family serine protease
MSDPEGQISPVLFDAEEREGAELPDPPSIDPPRGPWNDRVVYSGTGSNTMAYRPEHIHVRARDRDRLIEVMDAIGYPRDRFEVPEIPFVGQWFEVGVDQGDERYWVARFRDEALRADVDHVLFADSMEADPFMASPFMASPFMASPFMASPFMASPFMASPFMASPFMASPFMASEHVDPFMGNPIYGNPVPWAEYKYSGRRPSSARVPVSAPEFGLLTKSPAKVVVIDTGLAAASYANPTLTSLGLTPGSDVPTGPGAAHFLDPVAGHGTFIAGIVALLGWPTALFSLPGVSSQGDVSVGTIAILLEYLALVLDLMPSNDVILSLSFGSTASADMPLLAEQISEVQRRHVVVVASAGNDATCRRSYPAALTDVVSVGGLGAYGPAPFTNYGDWVRACAPAVNIASTFFVNFDGDMPVFDAMGDPDNFDGGSSNAPTKRGWAVWSGTSFAAPAVVAALCRTMADCGCTAVGAVQRLIDNPARTRTPGLGTVVNIALGSG